MESIFIIGAGAIGKVLAVFLRLQGKQVVIIRGSIDNKPSYMQKISVLMSDNHLLEAVVEISTLSRYPALDGIVVLANKSYGNALLAEKIGPKINHSPVVVMQNGLDVELPFITNAFPRVYRCVLFATSQDIGDNCFRFMPVATSPIGTVKGDPDLLAFIVEQLNSSFFVFMEQASIQSAIWTKTIVNCVFNSICPLLETDNGIFCRNSDALDMAKGIIQECVEVARQAGIRIDTDRVVHTLLFISKSSGGQFYFDFPGYQKQTQN